MPDSTCSAPACPNAPAKAGLCNRHYLRLRKTGSLQPIRTCLVEGCSNDLIGSQKLCGDHRSTCVEAGCASPRAGRSSRCKRHKNYGGALLPCEKGQKRCRACLVAKSISAFYLTDLTRDGRQDRCKECFQSYRSVNRGRSAAWRAANADWIREYNRAYEPRMRQLVNARNAAIRASALPFTVEQLRQRMAVFGNRCWICNGEYQQVDHVKPIKAGGPHILANMRPSCAKCNRRKNKTWPLTAALLERIRAA